MISIRKATVKDAKSIAKLNASEFGYEYPIAKTTKKIEYILTKASDKIFVVCIENRVVGYIHACDYEVTYFDSLKNIKAIAVDSNHQGKGLGRALLTAVENWAKEENCAGIRLVSGINREGAHKFYERCGYKLRKKQKNFIKLF